MFPTMLKPKENHKFTQGNSAFLYVAHCYFPIREVVSLMVCSPQAKWS